MLLFVLIPVAGAVVIVAAFTGAAFVVLHNLPPW